MYNISVSLDAYEMQLNLSISDDCNLKQNYKFQLEYSYLLDKEIIDEKTEAINLEYFFAYVIDPNAKHYLNDQEIKLESIENKDILKLLKNMFIVKDSFSKKILRDDFQDVYFLIEYNIEKDFLNSLELISIL